MDSEEIIMVQNQNEQELRNAIEALQTQVMNLQIRANRTNNPNPDIQRTIKSYKPDKPVTYSEERNESIETWIFQMEWYFQMTQLHADDQV